MITPTIHLNGTSADALIDALVTASNRITDAIHALADAAPNARDYYPQGPDAYGRARAEHVSRLDRLQSVHAELCDLYNAISDQADARKEVR